jgi:hypothetical protein
MTTIASAASLACALLSGCTGDLYIVFEKAELRGDERMSHGGGCVLVMERAGLFSSGTSSSSGGSGGSSGSTDGDLTVEEGEQHERYVVVVRSFGQELEHRSYGRDFLTSHKVDTFQVTTASGKRFEFSYRGSDECDPPSFEEPDAGSATRPG